MFVQCYYIKLFHMHKYNYIGRDGNLSDECDFSCKEMPAMSNIHKFH